MNNQKLLLVPIMLTIAVASALLVLSLSMMGNAQAQMYNDRNEYSSDHNKVYSQDDKNSKKSSDVNIQKINCGNSNINVNGININQIPTDDLATAEAANDDVEAATANTQNGDGLADRINFDRNLVNVCVNVNQNDQLKVGAAEEPATLTVNKEIFGCTPESERFMNCRELEDGSDTWLPCMGSTISGTPFCEDLPPNLFDIEVLDDQDTQVQQFEGSTAGTTIQNLQPGTYTVNEIKHATGTNQLQVNPLVEVGCKSPAGFTDGGFLSTAVDLYDICFEYEDEQDNDCSTVTLTAGEDKICTVKNYIRFASHAD